MIKILSKANQQKINKLEIALDQLKSGEKKYFSITKLISIKSLCKDDLIRHKYCFYLYKCLSQRLFDTNHNILLDDRLQPVFILIKSVFDLSQEELLSPNSDELLRKLLNQLLAYQNETKKVKWTTVRLIKNNELLTLELLLSCLLENEETAQNLAYHATRNYVEKYNSFIGTGLITDSIPALEEVLVFWQGLNAD